MRCYRIIRKYHEDFNNDDNDWYFQVRVNGEWAFVYLNPEPQERSKLLNMLMAMPAKAVEIQPRGIQFAEVPRRKEFNITHLPEDFFDVPYIAEYFIKE